MAHALTDLNRVDEARRYAALARRRRNAAGRRTGVVLAQTSRRWPGPGSPRQAAHRRQMVWLLFRVAADRNRDRYWTVRTVTARSPCSSPRPSGSAPAISGRCGSADADRVERLSRAMDDMGGRLRTVVVAVV